jgi:hypothetical protein
MTKLAAMLLLTIAAGASAGTTVQLQTSVADLPPGTRVHCEVSAQYVLVDPRDTTTKKGEPAEVYTLPAGGTFTWDFVAGANGTVPQRTFQFRFDKRLLSAPQGLVAVLRFPTKYSVACPAGASNCTSRSRDSLFGRTIRSDAPSVIPACLQFLGGPHGPLVGVGADCSDPRKNPNVLVRPNN